MHPKLSTRLTHYTLFRKLLDQKTPIMLVRILLLWYTKQTMGVKWGNCMADYFYICNGVRQGGILSLKLYSVHFDDLSDYLITNEISCQIDNVRVNHAMYADDICLMAPSPAAFIIQYLINIFKNHMFHNYAKSALQCNKFVYNLSKISSEKHNTYYYDCHQ